MKKTKVNASQIDGVQYRRTSTGKIILSQLTYLPMVMMGVLLTYGSYLQSAGYGIATAVAGVIITGVTLFDGFTDPIVARFIDNFNTKFGKIRILLWIGYGISAAAIFILFCVTSNGKFGMVTFIIIDLIFFIGYTIYCVTQQIIPPVLTNDPMQRPQINLWATLIGVFPPIIFMVYVANFMLPKYNNEFNMPLLREMCMITLGISFICLLVGMLGLKDADKQENFEGLSTQQEKVCFKDMVKMFKENKALQAYFFAAASDRLAMTVAGQSVVTTLLNGVLMRNMGLASSISMIPMLIGMIALFPIAKKNGRMGSREAMKLWTKLAITVNSIRFIFLLILMLTGYIDKVYTLIPLLLLNVATMAIGNIANNGNGNATNMMMADVIDYQCYLTGKYMPAVVSATYSFLDKMISSLGSTVTLSLLAMVGYATTMPQPTDEATMPIFFITMFLTVGIQVLGWIVNLIAMKINPLTREKMIEVQGAIAEKKAVQ